MAQMLARLDSNGRRFRIECKKYRDTSRLNERELLGES